MASLIDLANMVGRTGLLGLGPQRANGRLDDDNSFFGGVGQVIADNPLTLAALGGGIAQGGIGRGLQLALPALQADQDQRRREQTQQATYRALRIAGVPSGEALVGAIHPEVLKGIAKTRLVLPHLLGFGQIGDRDQGSKEAVDPSHNRAAATREQNGVGLNTNTASDLRRLADAAVPLNTIVGHLSSLMQSSKNDEISFPKTTQYSDRVQSAKLYRDSTAEKIANLFQAAGLNEGDVGRWKQTTYNATTSQELRAAVKGAIQLVNSHLEELKQQDHGSNNRSVTKILSPKSQRMLTNLQSWTNE